MLFTSRTFNLASVDIFLGVTSLFKFTLSIHYTPFGVNGDKGLRMILDRNKNLFVFLRPKEVSTTPLHHLRNISALCLRPPNPCSSDRCRLPSFLLTHQARRSINTYYRYYSMLFYTDVVSYGNSPFVIYEYFGIISTEHRYKTILLISCILKSNVGRNQRYFPFFSKI